MKKNMHRSYVQLRYFSRYNKIQNPIQLRNWVLKNELYKKIQSIDSNSSDKDRIQKQMVDYVDAQKNIKFDLAKIEPAKSAIEKISNNETPSKKEFTAYSDLKNQYSEFLEEFSDSEESNSSEFPKQTESEKMDNLNSYLKGEYKSSVSTLNKCKKSYSKLAFDTLTEKGIIKRKVEESNDFTSSKKTRQSVHDFIEDLPTDYNPLDDNGAE